MHRQRWVVLAMVLVACLLHWRWFWDDPLLWDAQTLRRWSWQYGDASGLWDTLKIDSGYRFDIITDWVMYDTSKGHFEKFINQLIILKNTSLQSMHHLIILKTTSMNWSLWREKVRARGSESVITSSCRVISLLFCMWMIMRAHKVCGEAKCCVRGSAHFIWGSHGYMYFVWAGLAGSAGNSWKKSGVEKKLSTSKKLLRFSDASSHLYKRECPSVGM